MACKIIPPAVTSEYCRLWIVCKLVLHRKEGKREDKLILICTGKELARYVAIMARMISVLYF
jgi:hypothetical protein